MSLSPVPLAGGAVLVQSHVVMPLRVRVLVERGGVRVVPVLFKLLSENTFPCELLLRWGRGGRRKRYVSKKKRKNLAISSTLLFYGFLSYLLLAALRMETVLPGMIPVGES